MRRWWKRSRMMLKMVFRMPSLPLIKSSYQKILLFLPFLSAHFERDSLRSALLFVLISSWICLEWFCTRKCYASCTLILYDSPAYSAFLFNFFIFAHILILVMMMMIFFSLEEDTLLSHSLYFCLDLRQHHFRERHREGRNKEEKTKFGDMKGKKRNGAVNTE